jgi:hypothetical protein
MKLVENSGDFAKGAIAATWAMLVMFIALAEHRGWGY